MLGQTPPAGRGVRKNAKGPGGTPADGPGGPELKGRDGARAHGRVTHIRRAKVTAGR